MAKICQVTGKRPISGNNVSHANNRTRRRFYPNLHTHRFWVESEKELTRATDLMNNRPRKCLGLKTPFEVFAQMTGKDYFFKPKCCTY